MRVTSINWSTRKAGAALAVSGIAAVVVGTGTVAAKTDSPNSSSHTPAKYRLVDSGPLSSPAGSQTFGHAVCPIVSGVQTRPTGGGAHVDSASTGANIKATYPDSGGIAWDVYVNNNAARAASFDVWAICSQPKTTYVVVSATADNPSGKQSPATVDCPRGDQVLGGGVSTTSTSLHIGINSLNPIQTPGWEAFVNNKSAFDDTMTVYAICSAFSSTTEGYARVMSAGAVAASGTRSAAGVGCPIVGGIQTSVLGVGEDNGTASRAFNITSVWPASGHDASTSVDNESDAPVTFFAWAVCAY